MQTIVQTDHDAGRSNYALIDDRRLADMMKA